MKTRCNAAKLLLLVVAAAFLSVGSAFADSTDAKKSESPKGEDWFEPRTLLMKPLTGTAKYRWDYVENKTLALIGPCGIVWQLNFGADLPKPYFHPLQTTDGRCLTWASPGDHPWHYALWHSWKYINGVNYWELNPQTHRPEGTTKITKADVRFTNETGARISIRLAYFASDKPDEVVMEETMDLAVDMPQKDGSYRIAWNLNSAPKISVVLDRTPPPGKKDGVAWGGYGGLSFRGSRFLTDVAATQSNGKTGMEANRQRADWLSMAGKVDGKPIAITIFDHPSNPGHPTVWYYLMQMRISEKMPWPFWYMNAAVLHEDPIKVDRGQSLALRYLVRVDGGVVPTASLEEEYKQFSANKP